MDELYNNDLFHQSFVIDGLNCNLISQFFIQVKDNHYIYILLLCNKEKENKLFLLALEPQNKKIVPIPAKVLNTVIHAMKLIPFDDEYQETINSLPEREHKTVAKPTIVRLTQNTFALVDSAPTILKRINIELELLEGMRIVPSNFVFAAFDGLNTNIHFVLNNACVTENRNWGVLSKICFYINEEFIGEYYLLNSCIIDEHQTAFLCQPKMNSILHRRKTSGIHIEGINIFEISDFIISSAGLYNSVAFPENYLKQQKWYTVVIPLIGLQFSEEFGLGGVEFCNKQNIEINRVLKFDSRFTEFETYALVHINDVKMHSAFMAAKRQIDQTVDLLVNILKDDSVFSVHSIGGFLSERNVDFFEKRVVLSPLIYIELPQMNARLSSNMEEPDDNPNLVVTQNFLQQITELEKIELLLIKANGTNDKDITPLFNSLKWIRKAWDTNDFDDKIICAVIALEFIVSKEKNTPIMDKPTRKLCEAAICEIIQGIENEIRDKDDYLEKVLSTFNRAYTESPFMVKLKNLIDRLNIPVMPSEMELISKARKQRNEIVHGRNETLLPTDDIYRLCECISKIAFYKLYSLEG